MAAQTNYTYSTPKGVPGGKYDLSFDEVVTRQNEEADGNLKYGMAVQIGAAPGVTVKIPVDGASAADIDGVVLHAANTEQDMSGRVVVKEHSSLSVMKKGKVWARIAADAEPIYGKSAYVVTSGDDVGTFTDKAEGAVDIGARFGTETDDGIAVVELR